MGAYDPVPNRAAKRDDVNADLPIGRDVPENRTRRPAPRYQIIADPSRGRRTLPWGTNHKTGNARD